MAKDKKEKLDLHMLNRLSSSFLYPNSQIESNMRMQYTTGADISNITPEENPNSKNSSSSDFIESYQNSSDALYDNRKINIQKRTNYRRSSSFSKDDVDNSNLKKNRLSQCNKVEWLKSEVISKNRNMKKLKSENNRILRDIDTQHQIDLKSIDIQKSRQEKLKLDVLKRKLKSDYERRIFRQKCTFERSINHLCVQLTKEKNTAVIQAVNEERKRIQTENICALKMNKHINLVNNVKESLCNQVETMAIIDGEREKYITDLRQSYEASLKESDDNSFKNNISDIFKEQLIDYETKNMIRQKNDNEKKLIEKLTNLSTKITSLDQKSTQLNIENVRLRNWIEKHTVFKHEPEIKLFDKSNFEISRSTSTIDDTTEFLGKCNENELSKSTSQSTEIRYRSSVIQTQDKEKKIKKPTKLDKTILMESSNLNNETENDESFKTLKDEILLLREKNKIQQLQQNELVKEFEKILISNYDYDLKKEVKNEDFTNNVFDVLKHLKSPLKSTSTEDNNINLKDQETNKLKNMIINSRIFVCLYDYNPETMSPNKENGKDELKICCGEYVIVFGSIRDDGFYVGELLNGNTGLLPSTFIRELTKEELEAFYANLPKLGDTKSLHNPDARDKLKEIKNASNQFSSIGTLSFSEGTFEESVAPPYCLTIERKLQTSILISWKSPTSLGFDDICCYHIYLDSHLYSSIQSNNRLKCLVTQIDSNEHRISITVITTEGRESQQAGCTILLGKDVNKSPSQVNIVSITYTSAIVSWLPSDSNTSHHIMLNGKHYTTALPGVYSFYLLKLKPNYEYSLEIVMQNTSDRILSSQCIFQTLIPKPPDASINVQITKGPDIGSLFINWIPIVMDEENMSNGSVVLGYLVEINEESITRVTGALTDHCILTSDELNISKFKKPVTLSLRTWSENELYSIRTSTNITSEYIDELLLDCKNNNVNNHHITPVNTIQDTVNYSKPYKTVKKRVESLDFTPIETVNSKLKRSKKDKKHIYSEPTTHYTEQTSTFRALYSYDPKEMSPNQDISEELAFCKDEIITVFGEIDADGFYKSKIKNKYGLVPSNLIEKTMENELGYARALYDYNPSLLSPNIDPESELSFKKNDIIKLHYISDDGFYYGSSVNHKSSGLIPSNFIKSLSQKEIEAYVQTQ